LREKHKNARLLVTWLSIAWILVLGSCAIQPTDDSADSNGRSPTASSSDEDEQKLSAQDGESLLIGSKAEAAPAAEEEAATETAELYPGSDTFINRKVASKPQAFKVVEGAILLNFENTNIREVVKTILGDILEENYVIDQAVQGTVTVQTGRPLPKEALIPVLETLLRMNNAALVRSKGLNKIVPINEAVQGNLSPRLEEAASIAGYSVRIVPLRYIGVTEMQKILEPFVPKNAILRVDPARNLLILAGTAQELAQWQETIDIFDVNWLEGMSVGLYKLQNTDVKLVVEELNKVLGPEAATPLAGMFRFVPIERLNGVLVITSQSKYLEEAKTWVERLDQSKDTETERFYVYQIQNGRAEHLAELLQQAFGQGGGPGATPAARVAPGRQATELFSSPRGGRSGGFGSSRSSGGFGSSRSGGFGSSRMGGFTAFQALNSSASQEADPRAFQAENKGAAEKPRTPSPVAGIEFGFAGAAGGDAAKKPEVRIIPDVDNNALLIVATSGIHEKILSVLRKLDTAPRQVLIEATIAEVQLTGDLEYGMEWFFNNKVGDIGGNKFRGTGFVNANGNVLKPALAAGAAASGGFTYALTKAGVVRALLKMAASDRKLNVLSSPQLLALDNQTAEIRVGDQFPVLTSRAAIGGIGVGGTAAATPLTSQVSYKDTGVLLTVTPRVNAGGRVTLEIRQEVTDVGAPVTVGGIQNFIFLQRTFESVVTVQSGQTIVLGGLIRSNDNYSERGVPFLRNLPLIGALFGTTTKHTERTELIVLMTPRVVRDQSEARLVTEEFREKLKNASAIVESEMKAENVKAGEKNASEK
jgi:general secretion pathway protein D